jgi:2-polyprenyl-3-methyl-5-hydroxy-6-metoxy-1,4-benzoquinol methylase
MSTTNTSACLICGSNNTKRIFTCTDHFVSGEHFDVAQCADCGFTFTNKPPKAPEIGRYYKSESYISHSDSRKGIINKAYHIVRNLMLRKKYKLISRLTKGRTLLDIGCGTGYFPHYMQTRGFQSYGMEIDENARNFAAEHFNLKVSSPEELLSQNLPSQYDVITLWHVMEHLEDTDRYLRWIFNSLKNDGVLIIALPNCSSYDASVYKENWAAYDVPRHLWHFTPDSISSLIKKYGFRLEKIKRLPFDAYYNSLMSARYAKKPLALVHGFLVGMLSNLVSFFNRKRCSSVIYVLKK